MSHPNDNGYVISSIENNIATIEFFHPQSNSLPAAILNALAAEIEKAGNDTNSLVIVLRSGGAKAFCAGASFDELIQIEIGRAHV